MLSILVFLLIAVVFLVLVVLVVLLILIILLVLVVFLILVVIAVHNFTSKMVCKNSLPQRWQTIHNNQTIGKEINYAFNSKRSFAYNGI